MNIVAIRTALAHQRPQEQAPILNRGSLGFWRVPDLGYAFSAAVTLKALKASGVANLEYVAAGAVTLKALSAWAEARYGPDDNPGRVTLKMLTVSGSLTSQAPVAATHTLIWKYNARDGGPVASWAKTYQGSRQIQIKRAIVAGTALQEFDITLLAATTVALTLYSTQDLSVVLNDDHSQTISLLARQPVIWTSDSTADFPFTSDVAKLFVSNSGTADANFTISALILDHGN